MTSLRRGNEFTPLSRGEIGLIRRALRYYINGEQRAVQEARAAANSFPKSPKHAAHAADVKQQADAHIAAAEALLAKLLPRSTDKE